MLWYLWEVHFLARLQNHLSFGTEFWLIASKLGDPAAIFQLLVPLIGALLSPGDIVSFILCGATSEFLNGVLKWIIDGPRPYWWIEETTRLNVPRLQQFSLTCETGPGNPSGHVMVSASVWFILAKIATRRACRYRSFAVWTAYWSFLAVVATSRLFIATHFPHQIFFGTFSGIGVGWLFYDNSERKCRPKWRQFLILIASLSVFAVVTFALLQLCGIDPNRSIKMAKKHCANPKWIHISTTPIHSLYRDVGAILGVAVATQFAYWGSKAQLRRTTWNRIVSAGISLGTVLLITKMPLEDVNPQVHYIVTVIQSSIVSIVSVWAVPYLTGPK